MFCLSSSLSEIKITTVRRRPRPPPGLPRSHRDNGTGQAESGPTSCQALRSDACSSFEFHVQLTSRSWQPYSALVLSHMTSHGPAVQLRKRPTRPAASAGPIVPSRVPRIPNLGWLHRSLQQTATRSEKVQFARGLHRSPL
jgi:hypothetical protein